MRWVTRHEPHVDRCASIWLIKTAIDPDAVFDFISRDAPVPDGAVPFTLPGAEIQPTGTATTFDALIAKYRVQDPIITRIADILRDFEIQAEEDLDRLTMKESASSSSRHGRSHSAAASPSPPLSIKAWYLNTTG